LLNWLLRSNHKRRPEKSTEMTMPLPYTVKGITKPESQKVPASDGIATTSPILWNTLHVWEKESTRGEVAGFRHFKSDLVAIETARTLEKVGNNKAGTKRHANQTTKDAVMAGNTVMKGREDKEGRTMKAHLGYQHLKAVTKTAGFAKENVGHVDPERQRPAKRSKLTVSRGDKEEPVEVQLEKHDVSPIDQTMPTFLPRNVLKRSYAVPQLLPDDFEPSGVDVIGGRGKPTLEHPGNKLFRAIVAVNMKAYQNARYRAEKRQIVDTIINRVRKYSSSGGFVKRDSKTGKWMTLDDVAARQKVTHALRDALSAPMNEERTTCSHDRLHLLSYALIVGDEDDVISQSMAPDVLLSSQTRKAEPIIWRRRD
jgi:hypothetical protein